MTDPTPAAKRTLILVDADGEPTEDRALAVGGEVLEELADGTTRSTLFRINPSAAQAS